ncbi:MAG: YihY family inner membrane protein [Myxococcales bacterium]|nr:YihY family inner membrane protein [Myxococcales bacterium]
MKLAVGNGWARARAYLTEGLWRADLEPRTWTARGVALLQFAAIVVVGFVRDRLLLRSSALTYFTVLSLVPVLAIVSSILSALGVTENVVGRIIEQIAAGAPDAAKWLREFVANVNFAGLGTLGAVTLFITTVLGISNVERALNSIWGVEQQRPLSRRIPDYLAVLVIAPLLLGTALSVATTLKSEWILQRLVEYAIFNEIYSLGLSQLPTLMLAAAFAFLYWFLPNTRVRPAAALLGGVIAAVLVNTAIGLYVGLSVGATRANALYGTFALLPLLFVWIYVFWALLLLGAEIAFAFQNLELYRREVRGSRAGAAECEAIGLRVALEVGLAFRDGRDPWTAEALGEALRVPVRTVRGVLRTLQAAHVVAALDDSEKEDAYQLGRPAERIPVLALLAALRGTRETFRGEAGVNRAVETLLAELAEGESKAVAGQTLSDLLAQIPPQAAPAAS